MNTKLKSTLQYLIFIGIGAFLLYLAFSKTDFEKLIDDLKGARYEYVIISMLCGYLAFVSRGIRWKYLLEPMGFKAKSWNAIHAISIGYFTNAIIPRAGEVARCTSLNQTDDIPVDRLFGTVIIERIVDLIMLGILALITLFLEYNSLISFFTQAFAVEEHNTQDEGFPLKIIILCTIGGIALLFFLFRKRFKHLPIYQKVIGFINGIIEGVRSVAKMKQKVPFILHTLFIWLMYYFIAYIVIFALPATSEVGMSAMLFVVIVAALGIIAPSPGGIGTYHYFVSLGLGVVGIAWADAFSFATLVHTGQTIMTLVAGIIAMIALYLVKRKQIAKS